MIPVELEDSEELKKWGMGLEKLIERCVFCSEQTRYWHVNSNKPVCPACAEFKTVKELEQSNG